MAQKKKKINMSNIKTMDLKKQRILTSYDNPILIKNEKLKLNTPELNILLKKFNYESNSENNVNYKKILSTITTALGKYSQTVNEYSYKWSSKTLITKLTKKTTKFSKLETVDLSKQINSKFKNTFSLTNNSTMPNPEVLEPVNKNIVFNYVKSISKFNSTHKGKLFNTHQQTNYNFNYLNYFKPDMLYTLILSSFVSMNSFISEPVYQETPNEMKIHLFMYSYKSDKVRIEKNLKSKSDRFIETNKNKLNILCKILSRYFKKPVNLQIVKLHYSYFDSNIFVNLLDKVINKITLRRLMLKFFNKAIIKNPTRLRRKNTLSLIPSVLSGIKIRAAGRLLTHRVVPRQTIKNIRRGALARGKVNLLNSSRITNKNKRGAYSITVSIGQNIK